MLAIKQDKTARKVTPNLIPCSTKHSGPINAEKRYWAPSKSTNNETSTAYFRGRKLQGKSLKLLSDYQGVVLEKTDQPFQQQPKIPTVEQLRRLEEGDNDEMDVVEEEPVEVKVMEQIAEFDEVVVWGHEMLPEDDDIYVRGAREWIGFAEAVSSQSDVPTLKILLE